MSGASTPRSAGGQPKQMSSRLLTMKFMQRAAASLPSQSQQTYTLSSQDTPSAKRQRLDNSTSNTPLSSLTKAESPKEFADRTAISAALKDEADARAASRAKLLREGGETEWVLSLNLPVTNGHKSSSEEDEDETSWTTRSTGRQTYGSFKRQKNMPNTPNGTTSTPTTAQLPNDAALSPAQSRASNGSASSSDEEGEISSSPATNPRFSTKPPQIRQKYASPTSSTNAIGAITPTSAAVRKKRKNSVDDDREARRMDSLNLSRMSSLSGHGGSGGFGGGGKGEKGGGRGRPPQERRWRQRPIQKGIRDTQGPEEDEEDAVVVFC